MNVKKDFLMNEYWNAEQYCCLDNNIKLKRKAEKSWKAFRKCFPSKRKAVAYYNK